MKITADTNVLVRMLTNDDEAQNRIANEVLDEAEAVVLTLPMLCELVWVLKQGYGVDRRVIAETLRGLFEKPNSVFDRSAVEAGLAMLDAGGDFADGVIAYEGRWLGADTFASFDREAVRLLTAAGEAATLLA